jgi:hypothetical protein
MQFEPSVRRRQRAIQRNRMIASSASGVPIRLMLWTVINRANPFFLKGFHQRGAEPRQRGWLTWRLTSA